MTKFYYQSICRLSLSFAGLCALALASPVYAQGFTAVHSVELKSDGPDNGKSAYKLIQKAFGEKAIEAPDLYQSNHRRGVRHIIEDEDDIVGPHFVFLSHRDEDKDRDKNYTDRQRNEIKAYDKSKRRLKAYEGETMQYRWKFKIDEGFEFSKNFTHFFQIKAKNNNEGSKSKDSAKFPVVTFTGVDKGNGRNEFQLRHSPSLTEDGRRLKSTKLVRKDMGLFTGQWVEFFVQITFANEGQLIVKAKNVETGEALVDFEQSGIDMWRGERPADFSRPKWGIYRSIKLKESLREEEEKARFADFKIHKGVLK